MKNNAHVCRENVCFIYFCVRFFRRRREQFKRAKLVYNLLSVKNEITSMRKLPFFIDRNAHSLRANIPDSNFSARYWKIENDHDAAQKHTYTQYKNGIAHSIVRWKKKVFSYN